jgi:hypothetical protein
MMRMLVGGLLSRLRGRTKGRETGELYRFAGSGKASRIPIASGAWVPHISLVFREMWDSYYPTLATLESLLIL